MHYSTKDYSRAIKIRFYVLEYNELEKMNVTSIFRHSFNSIFDYNINKTLNLKKFLIINIYINESPQFFQIFPTTISILISLYSKIAKNHEESRTITKVHERSRRITKDHEVSRNIAKNREESRSVAKDREESRRTAISPSLFRIIASLRAFWRLGQVPVECYSSLTLTSFDEKVKRECGKRRQHVAYDTP